MKQINKTKQKRTKSTIEMTAKQKTATRKREIVFHETRAGKFFHSFIIYAKMCMGYPVGSGGMGIEMIKTVKRERVVKEVLVSMEMCMQKRIMFLTKIFFFIFQGKCS